jgi:hypothetical protein
MKIIDQVSKDIFSANKKVEKMDKDNIVVIFQFITMTGIVAITFFLLYFTISKLTVYMDFKTPLPIIPMEKLIEQRVIDRLYAKQLVGEFYDLYTDLEIDFFLRTYTKRDPRPNIRAEIKKNVIRSNAIMSYDILEVHQEYGTSSYDKDTGNIILTDSMFLILLREHFISESEKVTSDSRAIVVEVSLDRDKDIRNIKVTKKHYLIDKELFTNYLSSINTDSIQNNLSYKSPLTSLSMSFMEIDSLSFGDLKMTLNMDGEPIAHSVLTMNGEKYMATVEYARSGNPILIIE